MAKQILKKRRWIAIILILAFSLSYSDAFAWGGARGGHGRYYWHGDRFYRHGWFWGGVGITALTIGAIVTSLPPRHHVVYVRSRPFYYDGTYYYRTSPDGYVVVADPTVVVPAQPSPGANTVIINVANGSGTYTPVTLTKYKDGYIGPQGEYYQGNPTVDQLRALYGK